MHQFPIQAFPEMQVWPIRFLASPFKSTPVFLRTNATSNPLSLCHSQGIDFSLICLYAYTLFSYIAPFNSLYLRYQSGCAALPQGSRPLRFWPISGFRSAPPDPSDTSTCPFSPPAVPFFCFFPSSAHSDVYNCWQTLSISVSRAAIASSRPAMSPSMTSHSSALL